MVSSSSTLTRARLTVHFFSEEHNVLGNPSVYRQALEALMKVYSQPR